jgi:2-oxo-4-hydroxy-4-carboxy--5-ureidoimidazoline (OHCU) decarboxylase
MPATPLQEMEAKLHEKFGAAPPSKEEAGEFLLKQYPRMDGGIAIAIALAALALQGWQLLV